MADLTRAAISRALDFLFSLALTILVSTQLGAYKVSPSTSSGYAALFDIIGVLLVLALKAVLFVLVPTVLLCLLLRTIPGLALRVAIYGVFALIGAGGFYFAQQRAAAETKMLEAQARRKAARSAEPSQEVSLAAARDAAARREADEHSRLLARATELHFQAQQRWRANLEASGAVGAEGEVPPMLAVMNLGNDRYQVTNLSGSRVCVSLARVLRKPGTDVYERCPLDIGRKCGEFSSRASAEFTLLADESVRACVAGHLEYRVGTPMKPTASWWSRSALDDFDRHPPDASIPFVNLPNQQLRGEIALLEKLGAGPGNREN